MKRILVTGGLGQIGSNLVPFLRNKYGKENVIVGDIREPSDDVSPFVKLDILDKKSLEKVIDEYDIDTIYHLAAILSAKGEQNPQLAFNVNILGLYNILEVGREFSLERIMVPSSIAAFGPETPKDNTPNDTVLRPRTMYGISKVTGELLGLYYWEKYGLDVRGVRYPGIISWNAMPGGGTTDYAVEIFHYALRGEKYVCFLKEDTVLPMMYMPDAIKALTSLAEAPSENLIHRTDFNVQAMSFAPKDLVEEIRKYIPDFEVEYKPDYRQKIADSWPRSLDDSAARKEWGWKADYDMKSMVKDIIKNLSRKMGVEL
ncbi:L-threonine 3-dehydrogenase [Candidatus Aciduliprofundum boonei]|uniref:NAD-dependent epimerase/dehydratase n=1 Tax=Aciduliprofundum boonei (strain DSM 19572 / T469) TaxID=439481 RepID=B5I9I7_ACIB4|nr:L-threonine 3-dehydrogenase [Candidatus Aciduliprofundum boonei]ADD08543.1 NAD-dependent epimerase/dehydratase [Aciduliprofundum boonei T469]EDY37109.1 NAD dependent epimerase/dehydratase family [Aciduliprofundum boonei T469]HII54622.1 L-threonine 3-dehydrogenase [Candidatus Aciduliprofundum boonei]